MYEAGSRAQRAFEAALTLPPSPALDLMATIDFMGQSEMPKEDPTHSFPLAAVQSWFEEAGQPLSIEAALAAAGDLQLAVEELAVDYGLNFSVGMRSFARKSKEGSAASLERALVDLSKACRTITTVLTEIRCEILHRKLNEQQSDGLDELHRELHRSFLRGQFRRSSLSLLRQKRTATDLAAMEELGWNASIAPTWLEDALFSLAFARL